MQNLNIITSGYSERTFEPPNNDLIREFSESVYQKLSHCFEKVSFNEGDIIYRYGEKPHAIYFPTTCVVSLICLMENGETSEVGLIANEGMLGLSACYSTDATTNCAIVIARGEAIKLNINQVKIHLMQNHAFQNLMLMYSQFLIAQISQIAVCDNLHSIEQRLSRWILMVHDRTSCHEISMTHQFISEILGVRRESISNTLKILQKLELIKSSRGKIIITNRYGLEANSCQCYSLMKRCNVSGQYPGYIHGSIWN